MSYFQPNNALPVDNGAIVLRLEAAISYEKDKEALRQFEQEAAE